MDKIELIAYVLAPIAAILAVLIAVWSAVMFRKTMETTMIHLLDNTHRTRTVCGRHYADESTDDQHKVTCKLCERWIRDNMAKKVDEHRNDEKPILNKVMGLSDELRVQVQEIADMKIPTLSASESWQMGFNAAKAHQADQRRWELAKELYQSRMTDLWRENLANRSRPSDDPSASFPDGNEQAGEVALLAVRDAAALLDAFNKE